MLVQAQVSQTTPQAQVKHYYCGELVTSGRYEAYGRFVGAVIDAETHRALAEEGHLLCHVTHVV